MKKNSVSIIIATYNSEKTIRRALDSVKNQIFQNWECIIVDGLSKDNTLNIVKEFANKDSRFRYISEKDTGIYNAFNKGWKLAQKEWCYYLGSDDCLLPDGLQNLQESLNAEWDCVYGNIIHFSDKDDNEIPDYQIPLSDLKGFMVCHQSILMKREVIKALNGFDERYKVSADKDIVNRSLINNFKWGYINCFVAKFNNGGFCGQRIFPKESYMLALKYYPGFFKIKVHYKYFIIFLRLLRKKITRK